MNELKAHAERQLMRLVDAGIAQGAKMLDDMAKCVITPYMVYPDNMTFSAGATPGSHPQVRVELASQGPRTFTLHKHALGQMAGEVSIPVSFVGTLTRGEYWERCELSQLLEERFQKLSFRQRGGGRARFISLAVGSEIRGFVSRSFKRYLRSGPIFASYVRACALHGALPVQGAASDLAYWLNCIKPEVHEVSQKDFVAVGLLCTNSDFGAGSFRIGVCVLNPANGALAYMGTLKEERHVGSAENGVGDSDMISDDTIEKKLAALDGEIHDVVEHGLSEKAVEDLVALITRAYTESISLARLTQYLTGKVSAAELKELKELLQDKEKSRELADISYDAQGVADITKWWAFNAVAKLAEKQEDTAKAEELRTLAGELLQR